MAQNSQLPIKFIKTGLYYVETSQPITRLPN